MLELNRAERKALVLAAVLLALGAIVREGWSPGAAVWSWRAADGEGDGLEAVREAVAEGVSREEEAARPLGRDERLDPNAAPEEQLRRLPGVGPVRARAMVEARSAGRFRTPEDLLRVPGIGEATLARIAGHLALADPGGAPAAARRSAPAAGQPAGATGAGPPSRRAAAGGCDEGVDVNAASPEALERLPWIGPARARQVMETRRRLGGFRSVDELVEVPGIGPYTLERLRPFVCVGRPRA